MKTLLITFYRRKDNSCVDKYCYSDERLGLLTGGPWRHHYVHDVSVEVSLNDDEKTKELPPLPKDHHWMIDSILHDNTINPANIGSKDMFVLGVIVDEEALNQYQQQPQDRSKIIQTLYNNELKLYSLFQFNKCIMDKEKFKFYPVVTDDSKPENIQRFLNLLADKSQVTSVLKSRKQKDMHLKISFTLAVLEMFRHRPGVRQMLATALNTNYTTIIYYYDNYGSILSSQKSTSLFFAELRKMYRGEMLPNLTQIILSLKETL